MQPNRLNDLSGKDWLTHSKTVMLGRLSRKALSEVKAESAALFSQAPPRDSLKKEHPATFSELDVAKLIRFFTRADDLVLDPFMGSGSTALACIAEHRRCLGFELYEKWHKQALARINATIESNGHSPPPEIQQCDALEGLRQLAEESVNFIVTSPPYWNILRKKDHKARGEREGKGLSTDYGNNALDLGNIEEYGGFLSTLTVHLAEYFRVLKNKSYAAVIVSDFREGSEYHLFHADIASCMMQVGFVIQGLIVLIQDNKKLYPYGYPTTFVPNISNQYIVVGRKIQ